MGCSPAGYAVPSPRLTEGPPPSEAAIKRNDEQRSDERRDGERTNEDPTARPSSPEAGVLKFVWRGEEVSRPVPLDEEQAGVYSTWLRILNGAGIPYALGGAYAVYAYTDAWRDSKDLDVFLEPRHLKPALDALQDAGFETEVRDRLWLAKVHRPPFYMDLLFSVRHTTALEIGSHWFASCLPAEFLGVQTCLLSLEELIASKIYLASRDRFDGADIAHLIRAVQGRVGWGHVIELLGGDEEIVLWHLLFFHYVYPGHADYLPTAMMEEAFERLRSGWRAPRSSRSFRGMLLDPQVFAVDRDRWGYDDTRETGGPLVDEEGVSG